MELTKGQIDELKIRIIEQIKSTFPEEKIDESIEKIENMNDEDFLEFLDKNDLISFQEKENQKCIFCSIVFGDISSVRIAETEKVIAILEIKPISKGHTIIVPKEHLTKKEDLDKEILDFSKEIYYKLKEKLNPKEIKIVPSNLMGHEIINLIPVYSDENIDSPRKNVDFNELEELKKEFEENEGIEEQENEEIFQENVRLPKRIP